MTHLSTIVLVLLNAENRQREHHLLRHSHSSFKKNRGGGQIPLTGVEIKVKDVKTLVVCWTDRQD